MEYTIQEWQHSADKNHTIMTWGTLKIDKKVHCPTGVTFYTYSIPLYTSGIFDEDFHKGVHTAEHLLAYKKDTGSVRNSLEEVSKGKLSGKVILDISPYQTSSSTFGFRITSMIELQEIQVKDLVKISIERAIEFLENEKIENKDDFQWIPFARSISCGQYDFHNKQRAIADLKSVKTENLEIECINFASSHATAYVCDLRFLKPKLEWKDDMITFSPHFSYTLSQLIEKKLPSKLPNSIALVGTFGCMTGMYLCVSSEIWDESDISHIHESIMKILHENIDVNTLWESEKIQFQNLIENYKNYSK